MAKEGSVAPKERVNIVYKPATGDAKEEVELPLKTLVVGDFTLKDDDTPVEDRKTINVDKDNFDDVLKAQDVGLNTTVKSTMSDDPDAQLTLDLDFKSMKDFHPDEIAKNVEPLQKLLEARENLKQLKMQVLRDVKLRKAIEGVLQDGSGSIDDVMSKLASGDEGKK